MSIQPYQHPPINHSLNQHNQLINQKCKPTTLLMPLTASHPHPTMTSTLMTRTCLLFALPIPGCNRLTNVLYQKCCLASFGTKVNCVFYLPIVTLVNPYWQCKLQMPSVPVIVLTHSTAKRICNPYFTAILN